MVHFGANHITTAFLAEEIRVLRCVKDWVRNGLSLRYAKKKF